MVSQVQLWCKKPCSYKRGLTGWLAAAMLLLACVGDGSMATLQPSPPVSLLQSRCSWPWHAGSNSGSTLAHMDLLWPILEKWVWEILCTHRKLSSPQTPEGCGFLVVFSVFLTSISSSYCICPVGPNRRFATMFSRRCWCHFVTENPGCCAACGKLGLVYLYLSTNHLFALFLQSLYSFILYPPSHTVYT